MKGIWRRAFGAARNKRKKPQDRRESSKDGSSSDDASNRSDESREIGAKASDWSREDNVWVRKHRYHVVEKLGEGGFSRVFKAQRLPNPEDGPGASLEWVAVKITRHPGPGVGDELRTTRHLTPAEREKHESAWVELLCHRRVNGHPNVVKLLDQAMEPDATAIVMEYAPGNLYERLCEQESGFDEELVRLWSRQLLIALDHVHRSGVVHRDVKLENLLLSADGRRVMLCDFGLAAFWDPSAKLKDRCGSPPYASPEILGWNTGYLGPEVDAWSAGVAIYLLRNGRYPFWADDPTIMPLVVCTRDPEPMRSDVSFDLAHLIQCLLAKDPYYRLDVSQALEHAFFRIAT